MKKYITKDKYEGLDPEIAELLKQDKMVKVKAWDFHISDTYESYLVDYIYGSDFPYVTIQSSYKNIEPILEDEVDWENLPVDTLLEVSNHKDFNYSKLRYLKRYNKTCEFKFRCFKEGRTSYTSYDENDFINWEYARLVKE